MVRDFNRNLPLYPPIGRHGGKGGQGVRGSGGLRGGGEGEG